MSRSKEEILSKVKEFEMLRQRGSTTVVDATKLISMEIALEWAAGARDEIPEIILL